MCISFNQWLLYDTVFVTEYMNLGTAVRVREDPFAIPNDLLGEILLLVPSAGLKVLSLGERLGISTWEHSNGHTK